MMQLQNKTKHRIFIIGGAGSGKPSTRLKLNNNKKIMSVVLFIKFIYMLRIQMKQSNQHLKVKKKDGLEKLKNPKAFIKYSSNMQAVYILKSTTLAQNVMH